MAEGIIPVGGVSVDVTPNAEKWNRMLRAAILAGTEKIGREAGAEVASGIKSEVKDAIPDAIKDSKPEAAAKVAGVKAGDSFAGSFDKTMKPKVERALNSLPDAKIKADTTDVDRKVDQARAKVNSLSGAVVEIEADTGGALAAIEGVQRKADALGSDGATIDVRVNAGTALAELAGVEAAAKRLDGKNVTLEAKVDTGAARAELAMLAVQANRANSGIAALIAVGAGLAPAIAPVAAVAAGGIAGMGAAAVGSAAGVGILVLAFSELKKQEEELNKLYDKLGKAQASGNKQKIAEIEAQIKAYKDGLAPATLQMLDLMERVKVGMSELASRIGTVLYPALIGAAGMLSPLMEPAALLVERLAGAMGVLAVDAARALTGPFWTQFGGFLSRTLVPALDAGARTVGNFGAGFAALWQGFEPVSVYFQDAFLAMSRAFASWAQEVVKTDGFKRFMQFVIDSAPAVGALLMNIVGVVANLMRAFAPLAPVVLTVVNAFLSFLATVDPRVLAGIVIAIGGVAAGIAALGPITSLIVGVSAAFGVLTTVATAAGVSVLGLIAPFALAGAAIVALGALVVSLWKTNDGFRDAATKAWIAVRDTIVQAWTNYILPALTWMRDWFMTYLFPVIRDLGNVVATVWNVVIKPAFAALVAFVRDVVGPIVVWLAQNVVGPMFNAIGGFISWAYFKVIRPVFDALIAIIRDVVGPRVSWLYEQIIRPVFSAAGKAISNWWSIAVKPAFEAFKKALGVVGDFVASVVKGIGSKWDGLRSLMAKPIEFVINSVIRPFGQKFNEISSKLGGPQVPIPAPFYYSTNSGSRGGESSRGKADFAKNFAVGGTVPGWSPNDSADNIPAMLTAREFVTRRRSAERMRKQHPGTLEYINEHGTLPPAYAAGGRVWPTTSRRLSNNYTGHSGIDIPVPVGTPVYAAGPGAVQYVGTGKGYGVAVFQSLPDGLRAVYGHNSRPLVSVGQQVSAGQQIALSGNTGRSTGPHVHFEVAPGGFAQAGNRAATLSWLGGAALQGGGLAGALGFDPMGFLRSMAAGATNFVFDGAKNLLNGVAGKFGDSATVGMVTGAGNALIDAAKNKLLGLAEQAGASTDSDASGFMSSIPASGDRLANARIIANVGRSMGFDRKGIKVALMTAMQESGLRNINYGDRDSVGLFQQRTSQGWGSISQIMNPGYSAAKFFGALRGVPGWSGMRETVAAQRVQRSAYPEAYQKHAGAAENFLRALGLADGGSVPDGIPANVWDIGPEGGWLPEGLSLTYNGLGKPEPLVRADLPATGMGASRHVEYHVTAADSAADVMRALERKEHEDMVAAGLGGGF